MEFDPTKPDLSKAIALNHHRNFREYGCKVIQLTVQEVARLGFLGFPRRPDYLHASPVCANFSQAHTAKAGKGIETADDLTAAIASGGRSRHRGGRSHPTVAATGVYAGKCAALSEQSEFCHHPECFGTKGVLGRLQRGQHG
ncbi:hypothetical protein [Nostoc sp. LEGE 12447]|uniref:hypothetical protein n=1 Tax=Nostoc sp. LEGE 12447 TaxID=1828640 RepID=UPI002AD591FD|nr:hypothetical protein [Nostoc sp. LEGE 12447]